MNGAKKENSAKNRPLLAVVANSGLIHKKNHKLSLWRNRAVALIR